MIGICHIASATSQAEGTNRNHPKTNRAVPSAKKRNQTDVPKRKSRTQTQRLLQNRRTLSQPSGLRERKDRKRKTETERQTETQRSIQTAQAVSTSKKRNETCKLQKLRSHTKDQPATAHTATSVYRSF